MTRHLLLAALGLSFSTTIAIGQEPRPAVRISTVRVDDEAIVRGQMPDPRLTPMPPPIAIMPPPQQPYAMGQPMGMAPPVVMGAPVPMGTVMNAPPIPSPVDPGFPMPCPDAALFAPGSPYALGNPNTATHAWFVNAEYLYWYTPGGRLPVLATTGPAASNGQLGAAGTQTLIGGGEADREGHSGVRLGLTYWFGTNSCWGLDVNGFWLEDGNQSFGVSSASTPLIARPFFNVNQNQQFSQIVAFPGGATGNLGVETENSLWGFDTNFRRRLTCAPCWRVDALFGFRYARFDESLTITENVTRTAGTQVAIGNPFAASGTIVDQFSTENEFYGGQLGLQSEFRRGRWFIGAFGKVALGEMQSSVSIAGSQQILLLNGSTTSANGGLLALPGANIGTYSQNKFSVLPEFGVNLGYHLTSHLRVYVGYNFLYLNNVLRPGDQIDTGLDVTRIPNFSVPGATPLSSTRPIVPLKDTGMVVQGINFGLQFSW